MAYTEQIYPLTIYPGIQKDGTIFASRNWIDGVWCRFYKGLPKKIGGYVQIIGALPNIVRGINIVNNSPNFNIYFGDQNGLYYVPINNDGVALGPVVNQTPLLFNADANNDWQFDNLYDDTGANNVLIAYAAPNLANIDNNFIRPVYFGNPVDPALTHFQPIIRTDAGHIGEQLMSSGGIVVFHPYLFTFGNDGYVSYSSPSDPGNVLEEARVTGSKIVAGIPTRGGNSSPAGLLWSLDSLIRVTFTGDVGSRFTFDTVTSESSILSRHAVIQYDSEYFWAGVDRFFTYNGIVQELPNALSLDFFFNNLNYAQRQKVIATKVTRWGEIWFFFATGNNVENNWAIVYNVREKTWYDTPLHRSEADYDQTFRYPIWSDNNVPGNYSLWMHENGVDKIQGNTITAIDSYFISGVIAWCGFGPDGNRANLSKNVYLYRFEPDFNLSGPMTLTISGREYANSTPTTDPGSPYTFDNTTEKVDIRTQFRQMQLKFESNVIGGDYFMGQCLLVERLGDTRP